MSTVAKCVVRKASEAGVGIAFCAKPAVREQVAVQLNVPDLSLAIAPLGLSPA